MADCLHKCCSGFGQRYVISLAVLSGLTLHYIHRVGFNLILTELVVKTNELEDLDTDDICHYNDTDPEEGSVHISHAEFTWSPTEEAFLLGMFYAGYLVSHLPGGIIADLFGPKRVFGYGLLLVALCSVITPACARLHVYLLMSVRTLMGIAQGPMFPALSVFVARWSLPEDRSIINSIMNIGVPAGLILGNACTGLLMDLLSWENVFYLYFAITLIWFGLWSVFAYDSAERHPFIGEAERNKLMAALAGQVKEKNHLNYCTPLRSCPVWATIVVAVGSDWAFYIVITMMPRYFSRVLKFNVSQNGLMSSLPWMIAGVTSILAAKLAQLILRRNWMSKTVMTKCFAFLANEGPVFCFVLASCVGCARSVAVALFTLSMGFMGFAYSSFRVANVDMAPNYAGFLMALMNGLGSLCGLLGPIGFNYITGTAHTLADWRLAFALSAGIVTVTTVVYTIWGTSILQPWNATSEGPSSEITQNE